MLSWSRLDRQRRGEDDGSEDAPADDQQVQKLIQPAPENNRQWPAVVQTGLKEKLRGQHENEGQREQAAAPQRPPRKRALLSRPTVASEELRQAQAELHWVPAFLEYVAQF